MIRVINARNVNEALPMGLRLLAEDGLEESSRNGPVLVARGPVITDTHRPTERVLFHPLRDANPFFHFFESLWMLAGRNDLEPLTRYVKRFAEYSDDGKTLNGAYGYRWRTLQGFDQLERLIELLQKDPTTRRAVLQMWDANSDLGRNSKDICCNTHCYFEIRQGAMNLTVLCRSNDMLWGAHGANAVHFSVLLEFVAGAVGVPVGRMRQFSQNYHIYTGVLDPRIEDKAWHLIITTHDRYTRLGAALEEDVLVPFPLGVTPDNWRDWLLCADQITDNRLPGALKHPFFEDVVLPMAFAHASYRAKNYSGALSDANKISASDWRTACVEWLYRREAGAQNV